MKYEIIRKSGGSDFSESKKVFRGVRQDTCTIPEYRLRSHALQDNHEIGDERFYQYWNKVIKIKAPPKTNRIGLEWDSDLELIIEDDGSRAIRFTHNKNAMMVDVESVSDLFALSEEFYCPIAVDSLSDRLEIDDTSGNEW